MDRALRFHRAVHHVLTSTSSGRGGCGGGGGGSCVLCYEPCAPGHSLCALDPAATETLTLPLGTSPHRAQPHSHHTQPSKAKH